MEVPNPIQAQAAAARPALMAIGLAAAISMLGLIDDMILGAAVHRSLEAGLGFELGGWTQSRSGGSLIELFGVLMIPMNFVIAMIFLTWVYRAYLALQSIGSGRSYDSPVWATVSWVVPFAQLWKPYGVMRELWQRSSTGNPHRGIEYVPVPRRILLWWLLTLAGGLGTGLSTMLVPIAPDVGALRAAVAIRMISGIAVLTSAFLLIRIVARIRDEQLVADRRVAHPNSA